MCIRDRRNYLLNGHTEIFGAEIGTLIYGAGKGIIRSFQDFDLCAEPYMKHPKNTIYYFGDMDYEGIGIYENLAEKFRSRWKIIPFVPAYQAMLCLLYTSHPGDTIDFYFDFNER